MKADPGYVDIYSNKEMTKKILQVSHRDQTFDESCEYEMLITKWISRSLV